MQIIYLDEAGRGADQPISVVAAVAATEAEVPNIEAYISRIYDDMVPPEDRNGFQFHASENIGGKGVYAGRQWTPERRKQLFFKMLSIPGECNLGISVGICRRTAPIPDGWKWSAEYMHHIIALDLCITRADRYVRRHCPQNEQARIVAEDCVEMRGLLRKFVQGRKNNPITMGIDRISLTKQEVETGIVVQEAEFALKVTYGDLEFASKSGPALLAVADACAYTFARYFKQLSFGNELMARMLRVPPDLGDWSGFSSGGSFCGPQLAGEAAMRRFQEDQMIAEMAHMLLGLTNPP